MEGMELSPKNTTLDTSVYVKEYNAEFNKKILPVSIVFGLTASVGLIANALVIYIYGFRYKRCNFKYFLFTLGLIGLLQCTIMLPTQIGEMHYWFNFPTSWLCRTSAYVFGYTIIHCYSILFLIALDRFRKVCRPYDWQIQANTARNLSIITSIASLILATTPGVVSGHHSFQTSYKDVNITVTVCATDDMHNNREWAVYFLLLLGGLPVSVIIIVTCTIYALILMRFYRQGSRTAQSNLNNSSLARSSSDELSKVKTDDQNNVTDTDNKEIVSKQMEQTLTEAKIVSFDTTTSVQNGDNNSSMNSTFKNIMCVVFPVSRQINIKANRPGNLRKTSSKLAVREKLLRKTCIVLIITITCIIALIITFCLHMVSESINYHALEVHGVILNAFVIFHRGSFSMICALFPIIYGVRDNSFRNIVREMLVKYKGSNQEQELETCA
ncbi:cholecystokinin receptor type A-like [Dreissena polymorpha]|uniref:G-protein coupled receptors family 1 profile domain-containing protein n=1 Tax=Dreissena polymorpha TaxID=45954 RepID=A0A9D4HPP4_DREPO|nr:cholecystokinin receptor type A-like [Dreissena polymorpha]KAH3726416.1 hypothetical protein DPMN_052283 [Dreissena polymorpha]